MHNKQDLINEANAYLRAKTAKGSRPIGQLVEEGRRAEDLIRQMLLYLDSDTKLPDGTYLGEIDDVELRISPRGAKYAKLKFELKDFDDQIVFATIKVARVTLGTRSYEGRNFSVVEHIGLFWEEPNDLG